MKRLRYENGGPDAIDLKLLKSLAADARASIGELARIVGLSAPSTSERLRRLEEAGVIEGYTVRINPVALGLPFAAWLRIRPVPGQLQKVSDILRDIPEIVECDRITGEDCFIARACRIRRSPGTADRPPHPLFDDQHFHHPVLPRPAEAATSGNNGRIISVFLVSCWRGFRFRFDVRQENLL